MAFEIKRTRLVALESGDRASSSVAGPYNNRRFSGAIAYLKMNTVPGGSPAGVKVIFRAKDSAGNSYDLNDGGTALNTVNHRMYILYPATLDAPSGFLADRAQKPLPELFDVLVYHLDGGTYNYRLELEFLD